jgi:xanthine dehydrogenase accessory factor
MRAFFYELVHALEAGEPAVLVSILTSGGSTPRGAGAMMAVYPGGRCAGTIGGGNVEFQAQKLAAELLERRACALRTFRFVQGDAASLGMVCGGDVTLHFQFLPAGDPQSCAVFREIVEASGRGAETWLVRRLEGERVAAMGTADRAGTHLLPGGTALPAGLLDGEAAQAEGWFAVRVIRAGRVYVFGGGHVSQALVPVLSSVGFRITVLDDRPEFTAPALFPGAEATALCSFAALAGALQVTPDDYLVIMTRGHQADYEVLSQTLRSGARYIGCIGSRHKLALCRDRLLAAGFTAEEYARVHAPIGLAIGAETPEEIAVSVAAEMIAVRAGA